MKRIVIIIGVLLVLSTIGYLAYRLFLARPYKVGETIQLADNVSLRVTNVRQDKFSHIDVSGVAEVFELNFVRPGPGQGIGVALEPWKDPNNTGVVLLVGATRVAPKAMAFAREPGSELEVVLVSDLAPQRNTGRGLVMDLSGADTKLQFLFDVPKEASTSRARLVVEILVDFKPPPLKVEVVK